MNGALKLTEISASVEDECFSLRHLLIRRLAGSMNDRTTRLACSLRKLSTQGRADGDAFHGAEDSSWNGPT